MTTTALHSFPTPESFHKAAMLDLLDAARAEIERGDTVALVMLPVHPGRQWSTRAAGDMTMLEIIGMLAVAQDSAVRRIADVR